MTFDLQKWKHDADCILRLNNVLGNIINNHGSLSRMDTMRLAELLLARGVQPPDVGRLDK